MEYYDMRKALPENVQKILKKDPRRLKAGEKDAYEFFSQIASETDGKIPKDIGEMLVSGNSDPDYAILIHRTSSLSTENAFKNGILNQAGSELGKTTSRYEDNMTLLINVRGAYGYKSGYGENSRCIVLKVPKTALEYTKGKTKPMLMETDMDAYDDTIQVIGQKQTVILPEYILGSIEFSKDGKMEEFVQNPNYTDVHDYQNDGLVCPKETLDDYTDKNNTSKSSDEINRIIADENNQYMREAHTEKHSDVPVRAESEIKEYSKKGLLMSAFNKMSQKIKGFFSKDKKVEQVKQNVSIEK